MNKLSNSGLWRLLLASSLFSLLPSSAIAATIAGGSPEAWKTWPVLMRVDDLNPVFAGSRGVDDVEGSSHDLTFDDGRGMGPGSDICLRCHAPDGEGDDERWFKESDSLPMARHLAYASADGAGGESAICLSCHDGVSASEGGTMGAFSVGESRANHPVSVTYKPGGLSGLRPKHGGFVGELPLFGPNRDQVECATCHDPHGGPHEMMLRIPNVGSNLCLTCHKK